jgi:hypothetical protein
MDEPKPKRLNLWRGKIGTQGEALQVIRGAYRLFYSIGGVLLIGGLLNTLGVLPEVHVLAAYLTGVVWIGLAYFLQRFHSRLIAMVLVLLSLIVVLTGWIATRGRDGLLSIPIVLLLWPSIRTLRATQIWHKLQRQRVQSASSAEESPSP